VTGCCHRAAGLTIAADRPICGLGAGWPDRLADVTIHTTAPHAAPGPFVRVYSETEPSARPQVVVSRGPHGYRFEYADGTRFWVDPPAQQVWMTWSTTFEDACAYLIGPIMGFVLRRRGDVALHASAVKIGDSAVAFVGPHGSGKSTTAAALARAGCAVITDDLLRLTADRGTWLAHPYGSVLRLWPASAALLYGDAEQLPRITSSWDKRSLALGVASDAIAATTSVPLRTVIFLSRSPTAEPGYNAQPVTGSAAILRLIANSSASHLLDAHARPHEFREVSRLAREVAALAITVGHGADALDRLTRYLLA
jgi:hypothetical protein